MKQKSKTKQCNRCENFFARESFPKKGKTLLGEIKRAAKCVTCMNISRLEWRKRKKAMESQPVEPLNPEKVVLPLLPKKMPLHAAQCEDVQKVIFEQVSELIQKFQEKI